MRNLSRFPPATGKSQLQQNRTSQSTVHAECFSVFTIHHTLTWTTGSSTCAQMLMHVIAHESAWTLQESALKVDSGRKISRCSGESNLRQRHAGPTLF